VLPSLARLRHVGGSVEVGGKRLRYAHPPCVGHELGQPAVVRLRQLQHQRRAVVAGQGENFSGSPGSRACFFCLVAD
jgi:hypothetical protein